ncbi:MAG: chloride channel protein family, partial [Bradyrhizobium sp.]|nr:chloride channel protein family [Bradyrhizobium sp.]
MLSPEKPAASGWHIATFEVPSALRALVRARESSLVILGALIGALAGLLVAAMSLAVTLLHTGLFGVPLSERLSAMESLDPYIAVLVPTLGGLAFGLALMLLAR